MKINQLPFTVLLACILVTSAGCSDDAPSIGTCSVEVSEMELRGDSEPPIDVLFSNADGTQMGVAQIDKSSPIASRDDCRRGTVISLFTNFQMVAHFGIDPDTTLKTRFGEPQRINLGDFQATLENLPAGADRYRITTGCGGVNGALSQGFVAPVSVYDSCLHGSPPTVNILASLSRQQVDDPSHYAWVTDLEHLGPETTSHTFDDWHQAEPIQVTLEGLAEDTTRVVIDLNGYKNGLFYGGSFREEYPDGDSVTTSAIVPPAEFTDTVRVAGIHYYGIPGLGRSQGFVSMRSNVEDHTFHVADLPPRTTGATLSHPTAGRPQLQAIAEGDMSSMELLIFVAPWSTRGDSQQRILTVIAPATTEPLVMPELPESLAENAMPANVIISKGEVLFVEVEDHGYRDIVESGALTLFDAQFGYYAIYTPGIDGASSRGTFEATGAMSP